ncbi:biotin/lipoyl-containing protein, partial [Brevundimonas sp.]|uniref:biotin/lipoyl-containing protein n=1 Tax=Brevundimonas sp. TaxID=1871086 RepID=UPI00289A775E
MGRFVFKLPDVGEGTAEAELVGWHVKVGDTVAEDQIVADVMTDKATVELTSPVAGVVTALHGEPGQMMAVRGPLAEFEVEGEGNAAADEPAAAPVAAAPEPAPVAVEAPKAEAAPAPVAAAGANHVFKLPDVGEGTAEAELVGWHVKVGDAVQEDQILAEVMTDKATVELTSPVSGVVVALHGEAGQQIAVGGPLVSFKVEGKGNVAEVPAAAPTPAANAEKTASAPVAAPAAKPAAAPKADAKPVPALTGRQPGE